MRRSLSTLAPVALLAAGAALVFPAPAAGAQGGPPPGGERGPGGPRRPFVWSKAHADSTIAEMLEHIKGKENMPAESVYKNIKLLTGKPAKLLPAIMVNQFTRSIGVGCGACHVRDDFASDDKAGKRVARQMWAMTQDLNAKYISQMKDIQDDMPVVTCWACHRGQHEPETDPDHPNTGPEGAPPGSQGGTPQSAH